MANAERGEVDLVTPTKVYTLAMRMNGLCEAQTFLQKSSYLEILNAIGSIDLISARYLLWKFLQKYHAKEFPGPDKVGDFIDDLPDGLNDAIKALSELFDLNAKRGGTSEAVPTSGADPTGAQS